MNSQPTTQTAADEDTIRAIHRRMIDAWNAGDSTAFAAPFTDRADFVAWDGTHLNLHHFRDGANDDPSLSVRVLIAAGQTKMQRSAYGLIGLLTLTAIPLSAGAAPAQTDRQATCVASVDAIRAEWRDLSHSSSLQPSQRIRTGDGREFSGSQLNYSHVLISRADDACGTGQVEQARGYVDEANKLLNPAPSGILATRAGN